MAKIDESGIKKLFSSMIVYPIAFAIGFAAGLALRPAGWKRALLTVGVAGAVAAIIGALEFSLYFGTGAFNEIALMVVLAALWCFAFSSAGFACGTGVRWLLVAASRAFRGN
ncbi:MAG TPA: hypothetical protein VI168_03150 [Croceibacterium sp.]